MQNVLVLLSVSPELFELQSNTTLISLNIIALLSKFRKSWRIRLRINMRVVGENGPSYAVYIYSLTEAFNVRLHMVISMDKG